MEREVYNEQTGQWEFYDPDSEQLQPPPQAPPAETRGPNWIPPPPNTPPRQGYQWMIDPRTNTWIETPIGSFPQTQDRTDADYTRSVEIDRIPGYGTGNSFPTGTGGFGNFNFSPQGWNWPTFSAPRFNFDPFVSPAPFEFQKFAAPTMEEAGNEPGYAFARDEGIKAMTNSASGRGALRSSGTLKDFIQFGNKFAEQNYGNVFNRARDTFNTNEGNRFNAYQANFGNALNAYGANRSTAESVFDRNYKGSWDEFLSKMEPSKLEFADAFNRWNSQLNALVNMSRPIE